MPLLDGYTPAVVSANIAELVRSGRPRRQAAAIALAKARRDKKRRPKLGTAQVVQLAKLNRHYAKVGSGLIIGQARPALSGTSEVGMDPMYVGAARRRGRGRAKALRRHRLRHAHQAVLISKLRKIHAMSKVGMARPALSGTSEVGCGFRTVPRRSVGCGHVGIDMIMAGLSDTSALESLGFYDESFEGGESPDDVVGFSLGSITRSLGRAGKSIVHAAGTIPLVAPATRTLAKIMQNPIVSTAWGEVIVPANVALGFVKGGPKGALTAAKAELRNPVRRAAVTALGTIFPPAAPAAVALNAANVLLDASESKDPVAAAKAAAQLASVAAGADAGDGHMKLIADVLTKADAARKLIPRGRGTSANNATANNRAIVCGAKGEDQKGIWLRLNVRREGPLLKATLYSVAAGNPEVFNLSVDLRPLARLASTVHARMHRGGSLSKAGQRAALDGRVSGLVDSVSAIAEKLGQQKLQSMVTEKTRALSARAGCRAEKPPVPVSDAALASYAAARSGVEAVDNLARVQKAFGASRSAFKRYAAVKNALNGMSPTQKAAALKRPEVRKAVIDGVSAKAALSSFAGAGGVAGIAEMQRKSAVAKRAFANILTKAKAGDPQAAKMAAVVSVATRARLKIQDSAAQSRGGLPGLVIGPNGRLKRGRFSRREPAAGEGTSVILTAHGTQQGAFDAVSGSSLVRDGANYLDNVAEDQLPFELSDDQEQIEGMGTKVCCYGG